MRYRVIRDGEVINQVEWDRTTGWRPPEGCTLEPIEDAPDDTPDADEVEATRLMHEAMALLSATDFVVIKATEKDRTLSPDWLAWRDELRAVVATRSGVIREEPARYSARPVEEPEPAQLLPPVDALMSDYGPVGTDDITGDLLLDAFEQDEAETAAIVQTLTALKLKHLSEQLNVERARLDREHQATGVANPRSASIDRLLGLLTRRGEV